MSIDFLRRRRALMTMHPGLPKEYFEVDYIQSTGEQWIDTGIISSSSIKTEVKFKANDWAGAVFGNYKENGLVENSNTLYIGAEASGYLYSTNAGNAIESDQDKIKLGDINLTDYYVAIVDLKDDTVSLDGNTYVRVPNGTW